MADAAVVIVGAGHSGAQAAVALRQRGYPGSIAMIGSELDLPYQRPPLSKEFLSGERTLEQILIRPAAFWATQRVNILLGRRAEAVDPQGRTVRLDDGSYFAYESLIWAAGGSPRHLTCPGRDLDGVHSVRNRGDVEQLRRELKPDSSVAIVGGGYIGLEIAGVLVKRGIKVTVLEAQDRVLARVAGRELSTFFAAAHRAQGVDVRTSTVVNRITGAGGRATGVQLHTGETIRADLVIVGIGIEPSIEPLTAAGALGDNGVLVDEYCRTSLPGIYGIGDCALHVNRFATRTPIRLESVQNANDQASTAARAIAGNPAPYEAIPWFWSNQYDLRLQTIGLSAGYDQTVMRGDPERRSFSVIYLRGGRVRAIDSVNAAADFAQGRKLLLHPAAVDPERLADTAVPLSRYVS